MTPDQHAALSQRDFGGKREDYMEIHKFLDRTKLHVSTYYHRIFLHNTFGVELCEIVFGDVIVNSDGKHIAVREIARRHIIEDCGTVPTLKDILLAVSSDNYGRLNMPSKTDLQWLKKNY